MTKKQNNPAQVTIPEQIRAYRKHLGLTVLKFSWRYEVSPQAVYMWESGQREAPYKVTQDVLNWLVQGGHRA